MAEEKEDSIPVKSLKFKLVTSTPVRQPKPSRENRIELNSSDSDLELSSSSSGSNSPASYIECSPSTSQTSSTSTLTESLTEPMKFFPLLRLPDCALEIILGYLSFDHVAQLRIVSKAFNNICKRHLNKGFRMAERYHARCLKEIKAKLPRRESVRRNHPFSRHSDILSAIETRMSLLSMTFMKYVDMGICCFIPGRVIDEIFRVLRIIKSDDSPPRAYEILQELRDISSMAMEYFDERIVPTLKMNANCSNSIASLGPSPSRLLSPSSYMMSASLAGIFEGTPSASGSSSSSSASPAASTLITVVHDVVTVQQKRVMGMIKRNRDMFSTTQKTVGTIKKVQTDHGGKISTLEKSQTSQESLIKSQAEKLKEQEAIIATQAEKLKETESRLQELSQIMADYDKRLSELSQKLSDGSSPEEDRASVVAGRKRSADPDESATAAGTNKRVRRSDASS